MADPTTRALRLLSLLQTHRFWSGAELATRLGVTERTLRRDIDRLREFGYRVAAHPGVAGGYQLESGSTVPPLLIDDDEAVAIAVGLRIAAVQGVGDGEHTSLSALAKLEQVLPRNLRRRVSALQEHTMPSDSWHGVDNERGPGVQADVLAQLALGCRDHVRLRFDYAARSGAQSRRLVEPHVLVPRNQRWYLIAWDVDRDDWRTFRIDRLSTISSTGVQVPARKLTPEQAAEFVTASSVGSVRVHATVRMRAGLAEVRSHFGVWASEATEGPNGTVDWPIGGNSVREMLMGLLWIPPEYEWELLCDDDVAAAARDFSRRLAEAVGAGQPP